MLACEPDLRDVLAEYLASMSEKQDRLRTLLSSGDLGELRTESHRLAGSAGSYGFPEMSRLASLVEGACTNRDAAAAALATLDLIAHIARVEL